MSDLDKLIERLRVIAEANGFQTIARAADELERLQGESAKKDHFISQVKYELHRSPPADLAVRLLNHVRDLPQ